MPWIELSRPKTNRETKAALRFFEFEPDSAATGGKLCGDRETSPYLHMLVYCPRLKRATKQKMGAALAEAFAQAVQRTDWIPFITNSRWISGLPCVWRAKKSVINEKLSDNALFGFFR